MGQGQSEGRRQARPPAGQGPHRPAPPRRRRHRLTPTGAWRPGALLWFGQYIGRPIASIPRDYLRWLASTEAKSWRLVKEPAMSGWPLDGGKDKIDANHAVELHKIADDPGERNDLAVAHPAKRDELLADLLSWISRVPAPLPAEPNPAHAPEASPAGR